MEAQFSIQSVMETDETEIIMTPLQPEEPPSKSEIISWVRKHKNVKASASERDNHSLAGKKVETSFHQVQAVRLFRSRRSGAAVGTDNLRNLPLGS